MKPKATLSQGCVNISIQVMVYERSSLLSVSSPLTNEGILSTDYYGAGAVIGEALVLEERESNLTVVCDTDVQAFVISQEDLKGIMASFPALKEQLWRIHSIHTATELLATLPEYQVIHNSCSYVC